MVTNNHYRWDFVGLSTDEKPTPDTSDKVVDGSTFYCSDTSKLYVFCKSNWYERKPLGNGGGGTSYTAGEGITIADDTISVDTTTIQEKLTAGTGINITNNIISATGGGGGVTTLTSADYNYPANNPNSVALWLLNSGTYVVGEEGMYIMFDINTTTTPPVGRQYGQFYYGGSNPECLIINYSPYLEVNRVRISDGTNRGKYSVVDTLTSQPITASTSPLSARQGKVLYDYIGDLTSLTTTDKTSLVNAINELAGRLSTLEGN